MATWGVHLRIAEKLFSHFQFLDKEYFIIGNIGPDCGKANGTYGSFEPSKQITHCYDSNGKIDYETFYLDYLYGKKLDKKTKSYLMGYYSHLITDYLYTSFYKQRLRETDRKRLTADKSFIITLKEDWYDVDHKYFRDHPISVFTDVFCKVNHFDEILNYFPKGATIEQIENIKDFYGNPDSHKSGDLDREYEYYTEEDASDFVELAVSRITECIEEKI